MTAISKMLTKLSTISFHTSLHSACTMSKPRRSLRKWRLPVKTSTTELATPTTEPTEQASIPVTSSRCLDSNGFFIVNGILRNCEWLAKQKNYRDRNRLCQEGHQAHTLCLETCNNCPTTVPQASPTKAPAQATSVKPSVLPNIFAPNSQSNQGGDQTSSTRVPTPYPTFIDIPSTLPDGQCLTAPDTIATRYNDVSDVPPYVGIMFSIHSKDSALEILTLELDVISKSNFSVEIFTREGNYENHINDQGAWEMVADTLVVPSPNDGDTGVVVPVDDFKTVAVKPREIRSFYITMKGPYLDHTVQALVKTGETFAESKDMDILTGVGLTEYKFPEDYDRVLDPQFAGVFHYRKQVSCDEIYYQSTVAEYLFFTEQDIPPDRLTRINTALNLLTDRLVRRSVVLQESVENFSLVKSGSTETVFTKRNARCPEDWQDCSSSVISTKLRFEHLASLSSNEVLYQLHWFTDIFNKVVQEEVGVDIGVRYAGPQSFSATFELTLTGTPTGAQMDENQLQFFKDSTQGFLEDALADSSPSFLVSVEDQRVRDAGRLLRVLQVSSGSITIYGKINGVQGRYISRSERNFADSLENAFGEGNDQYLDWLAYDALKPSELDKGDFQFFENVSKVSASFEPDVTAKISAIEQVDNSKQWKIYVSIVAAIVGLVGGFFLFRYFQRKVQYKRERKQYREEMREMRKNKRKEKEQLSVETGSSSETRFSPSTPQ